MSENGPKCRKDNRVNRVPNPVRFTDSLRNVNLKTQSENGVNLDLEITERYSTGQVSSYADARPFLTASKLINVQASLSRVFRRARPDDEKNFCRQSQALRSQTALDPQTFDMPATAIV